MPQHDSITQDVKTKAQDLGEQAVDTARAKVEETAQEAQDRVSSHITEAANAADAASDEFAEGTLQAKLAEQVASRADEMAQAVADLDVTTVTNDISDFARRNPLLFLGGALLAGVAAARFLKARDPHAIAKTYTHDDPWQSRVTTSQMGGFDVPS